MMEKLRSIKNRLSVSVDKLSPNRRGRSSNRQSMAFGGETSMSSNPINTSSSADPLSSASPGRPVRRNRNKSARPNSLDESDIEDMIKNVENSVHNTSQETLLPSPSAKELGGVSSRDNSLDSKQISNPLLIPIEKSLTPSKLDTGSDSLVQEVMKEFERRELSGEIEPNTFQQKSMNSGGDHMAIMEDKLDFIDNADDSDVTRTPTLEKSTTELEKYSDNDISHNSNTIVQAATLDNVLPKTSVENIQSTPSTLHAESMTSGYFSDSTSESSNTTKPKEYATVFSTLSHIEDKPPPKKESIYSKLLKRREKDKEPDEKKDKEPNEKKVKEPLYARIKPKLKLDTGFKPIEPESTKTSVGTSPVIKPEPIYSKVKPRTPVSPISSPTSPNFPTIIQGSSQSSFSPLNAHGEPIYSKMTPKSSTLPSLTPHNYVPQIQSKTFPRNIPLESPRAKYPIYTQPLPALPKSNDEERGRQPKPIENNNHCDRVTVRAKEISPVRANLITISNPVYIPTPPSSPRAAHPEPIKFDGSIPSLPSSTVLNINDSVSDASPPVSPPSRRAKTFISSVFSSSSEKMSQSRGGIIMPPPKAPKAPKSIKDKRCDINASSGSNNASIDDLQSCESSLTLNSDAEQSGRTLSRLVEELAVELETVSRRLGNHVCSDDDSKKEVLSKLLATYDVPKNLRRVPEVDEEEVLRSERYLIPISSANYLNEEHVDTFYADVPDFSHDEFVIALDDENDPKYASLTREMRQQQQHRGVVDVSPGKVSRRSAQVYMNVINVLSALKVLVNSNSAKAAGVVQRMGTIARPYAKKVQTSVHTSVQDTSWIQRRIYHATVSNIIEYKLSITFDIYSD